MTNILSGVQIEVSKDSYLNKLDVAAQTTQVSLTGESKPAVLRQEATTADFGIILGLALVIAWCWARIGKR